MTKTKTFILCLSFGLTSILTVQGQTKFEVPQNVELKTKDDYAKYETAISEAAKWLEETDLNKETEKRQQVNAFVLQWVSGSPTINVDINEQLGKIYGKNAQLLGVYLASYARNFLENKSAATKFSATKAGLISMMNVYKKGIEISKSKEMDKLIKLTDENKLDDYINEKFK
ncbi:MAG: hypothetical protein ICV66_05015 [Chitinophagaceae bacterium]|nr:hypothetical protein [Chitinophagaceae bacterium]